MTYPRPDTGEAKTTVEWCDPPELGFAGQNTKAGKWIRILEPLMERPGQWARVHVYEKSSQSRNTVSHLKRGIRLMPPGRWEFVSRQIDEGFGVWAKYLGPEDGQR